MEHAAFVISMFGIGRDGKEPYKLLKGKSWHGVVYEFGEGIQFRPIKTKGRYKLDDNLMDGVFLGVRVVSTYWVRILGYTGHGMYTDGLFRNAGTAPTSTG